MIQYLPWDSEKFGYKIGKISFDKVAHLSVQDIRNEISKQNFKLIYFVISDQKILASQNLLLGDGQIFGENLGGMLVDTKVQFSCLLSDIYELVPEVRILQDQFSEEKLMNLALQSGLFSRFKTDKNFKNNEFEKLYTLWMENSINGKLGDIVLITGTNKNPTGMLTLKFYSEFAEIGLLAVDENLRGKSLGRQLMFSAFYHAQKNNCNCLKVNTQLANTPAYCFYKKMGFEDANREQIYHVWNK